MTPPASTMPGLAMPMPSSGRSASATSSRQIRPTRLAAAAAGLALAVVGAADDDLAGEVDEGADEVGRLGEVEAEDVAAVGVDADERRRLADAARRAQAELLDDSVVQQVADHGGDRRPGEPGDLGQVGARQRPVAVQRAQQEAAVRPSGVFRRRHSIVCLLDKQIGSSSSSAYARGVSFTEIPVVDLRRWHADDRPRARRVRRRAAPDLPRGRFLPARRPRCARRVPPPLLRVAAGVLRPPRGRQGDDRQAAGHATSAAGSGSAPSSPTTAPTSASSSTSRPSTRRTPPMPSRRTCASTGPTSGCPRTSCPGSTAPSTSSSPASAPSPTS